MRLSLLSYSNTTNIGDNIQTIAVAQHVRQEFDFIDRDFLNSYDGDPCVVVMNGWFTHEPTNWPPSPAVTPLFFGFHLAPELYSKFERHKAYFKRFAPIGCRDPATVDIFTSWGVDAYLSGCATMTFPRRNNEPAIPRTILVDQTKKHFRPRERKEFVETTHSLPLYLSSTTKLEAAKDLLDYYKKNAGLIVTSRIHCAMPCAAMGIPTIYTGIREGRTAVIDMIGIPSIETRRFPRTQKASLPIKQPQFEETKQRITADLHRRLIAHGIKVRSPVSPA